MADDSLLKAFKFDFDVRVNVRCIEDGKDIEEPVFSHRLVLSCASALFRGLLSLSDDSASMSSIDLDLRAIPNALRAFRSVINALYSGEVSYTDATPAQILLAARICQISSIESKVTSSMTPPTNQFALLMQQQNNAALFNQNAVQTYLQSFLALCMQQHQQQTGLVPASMGAGLGFLPMMNGLGSGLGGALGHAPLLTPPSSNEDSSSSRTASDGRSEGSSPRQTPPLVDTERILPNDDKEGWCRNKKYIEKVEGGFMCTVCRKIYGRYNSVSYHVTIYHRNPPIRCDEPGCQFATREARYIHFHKYYRHHIPLPDSIDLGSRKCPYCRHVSKSPAMLEKHIARHDLAAKSPSSTEPHSCDQCLYRCKTADLMNRHRQIVHSDDVTKQGAAPSLFQANNSTASLASIFPLTTPLFEVTPPESAANETIDVVC